MKGEVWRDREQNYLNITQKKKRFEQKLGLGFRSESHSARCERSLGMPWLWQKGRSLDKSSLIKGYSWWMKIGYRKKVLSFARLRGDKVLNSRIFSHAKRYCGETQMWEGWGPWGKWGCDLGMIYMLGSVERYKSSSFSWRKRYKREGNI